MKVNKMLFQVLLTIFFLAAVGCSESNFSESNAGTNGNFDIKGDGFIDDDSEFYGSLHAEGNVYCGNMVKVHGNIVADGDVNICNKAPIVGDISANRIFLSKTAVVQGTLLAKNGITFIDSTSEEAGEKVKRFESNADVVDEVKEMLGTNKFIFHGYVELFVENRWIRCTPVFEKELCEKLEAETVEFDGRNISILPPFDKRGRMHFEYIKDRGDRADVPFDEIMASWVELYPLKEINPELLNE